MTSRFDGLREATLLGATVPCAERPLTRLLGLAWLDPGTEPAGLLIPSCRSVHTFGMRFAIDIHFLDADGSVLRMVPRTGPNRMLFCRRAKSVLEIRSI